MTTIIRTLRGKLAISFAVFAIVFIVGCLLPLTPPATFDANARIWIQSKGQNDIGEEKQSSSLFQSFMTYFNSPILTACEVLKSQLILDRAIKELKDKIPEQQIPSLSGLKDNIRVEPVRDTDIVAISYADTDAHVAESVLQAILDAFLRLEIDQTTFSAVQSKSYLKSQLQDAQGQQKKIAEQLRSFEIEHGLIDLQGQVTDLLKNRNSLEQSLNEAEAKMESDKKKVAFLESHAGISVDDALKANGAADDPVLMQSAKKLAELETKYAELSTSYRPEHPEMKRLKNLIEKMRHSGQQRLTARLSRAGVSLANPDAGTLSTINQDVVKDMVSAKSDQLVQQSRIDSLSANLDQVDEEVAKLPDTQLQLADLLRAQKVVFERISSLETNINSAKLIEAVNTHTPNFQVIDPPQIVNVIVTSRRPKLLTAFFLGIVLGILTFFLLDRLDPRLRRIAAVTDTLSLPVVGWLNHLPQASSPESMESVHRLRLGLMNWLQDGKGQFVITSADVDDGKSDFSLSLAISFAQSGVKVLLIDGNLHYPSVHKNVKNLPISPGLSDYLASPDPQAWSKIVNSAAKNLNVITAGGQPVALNTLLASERILEFMQMAQKEADIVIYDTPSISQSAAAFALLTDKTNLLVLVRLNHTHQPNLLLLATQLKQHEYGSAGIVLVDVEDEAVANALTKASQQEEFEPA